MLRQNTVCLFLLLYCSLIYVECFDNSLSLSLHRKKTPHRFIRTSQDSESFSDEISFHNKLTPLNVPSRQKSYKSYTSDHDVLVSLKGSGSEYWATIQVGSPPQTIEVQIDTGSALLAVPGMSCATCEGRHYNNSLSRSSVTIPCSEAACVKCYAPDPYACAFDIKYFDQSSITGYLTSDIVAIGNISATTVFGTIEKSSDGFEPTPVDGILGMAFNGRHIACSPSCVEPFWDSVVRENDLNDIFGLMFKEDEGILTLGGIDHTLVPEGTQIAYTDLVPPYDLYQIHLKNMMILDHQLAENAQEFGPAIIDSGSSYTYVPESVYNEFVRTMQGSFCHLSGVCGAATIFNGSCLVQSSVNITHYPTILFEIVGGDVLEVPPTAYFALEEDENNQTAYCLGIQPAPTHITVLGDTFMRAFYVIFDRKNTRVGFYGGRGRDVGGGGGGGMFVLVLLIGGAIIVVLAVVMVGMFYRQRSNYATV